MLTKSTLIVILNIILIPISDAIYKTGNKEPPEFIFYGFIVIMLSTEILLIASKGFRSWIRSGVENGDGVLNSKDINGLIIYYASLWFLRLFILNILLDKFYQIETDFDEQIMLFFGSTGSQGIGVIRSFVIKSNNDTNQKKEN